MLRTSHFAVLLLVAVALAQPVFEKRWCWSAGDLGRSVAQTDAGAYVIGAETWSATGGFGMLSALADQSGETTWVRRVGNVASGSGYSCLEIDNTVVLAGRDSAGRIIACKYDQAGDSLWSYVSGWRGRVSAVVPAADTGCLIVGRIPDSMCSFGAIRLDARGQEVWARCYPATGMYETWARGAAQDSDSGFIICGDGHDYGYSYARLLRVSQDGEVVWSRLHRGQTGITLNSVVPVPGRGYLALGTNLDTLVRQRAVLLLGADTAGAVVSSLHLVPPAPEVQAAALRPVGDDYALCAALDWYDSARVWLVRTSAAGDTLWSRVLGRASRETPADMVLTADSGYAIVGSSDWSGSSVFLFKTDSLGRTATGVVMPGQRQLARARLRIVPNPTTGSVLVSSDLPADGARVCLELCDVAGRVVRRSEPMVRLRHRFSLAGLSAGTYLVRFTSAERVATGRIVVR